ncbi:LADA_0H03180g1_1 [Lachancea dasiensis]|uniref:LADA_0H03180g1_1 n=1 Tax=Lachancea dasiensis TaxID=1072105 RepID=A0A1G4K096_9SACH|nr:LADA_0H03180g1_1 [Lachancea dasiensis]
MSSTGDKKVALRTCVRCRRNKIKCDLQSSRPEACSSCRKRGVECVTEYVVPHQRSQEVLSIVSGVVDLKSELVEKVCRYEYIGVEAKKKLGIPLSSSLKYGSSKVISMGEGDYVIVSVRDGFLNINNCSIKIEEFEVALDGFRNTVGQLLNLYGKWEADHSFISENLIVERTDRYNVLNLFWRDELPLLLCLANFYYEVPGLRYRVIYDRILEDFCHMAIEDVDRGQWFDKRTLSRYIVGENEGMSGVHFNGEMFIKKLTLFLFYQIILYGFDHYMDSFMSRYIRTLENVRKKVNIEKNWEVKWVNFYVKIFDLITNMNCVVDFGNEGIPLLKLLEIDSKILHLKEEKVSGFSSTCLKYIEDMKPFLDVDTHRASFWSKFVAQFVTLNLIGAGNACEEGHCIDAVGKMKFNGFDVKPMWGGGDEYSVFEDHEGVRDAEFVGIVHKNAVKRLMRFEDFSVYDLVVSCFTSKGYEKMKDRCCCKMIKDLLQSVVMDGMIAKIDKNNGVELSR